MTKGVGDSRGTENRGIVSTGTSDVAGNPGTYLGTQTVDGVACARFRAKPGTWISSSLKKMGYDQLYTRDSAYGAYAGVVRKPDGRTLVTPDEIQPGQEYLIPVSPPEPAKRNTTRPPQNAGAAGAQPGPPPSGRADRRPAEAQGRQRTPLRPAAPGSDNHPESKRSTGNKSIANPDAGSAVGGPGGSSWEISPEQAEEILKQAARTSAIPPPYSDGWYEERIYGDAGTYYVIPRFVRPGRGGGPRAGVPAPPAPGIHPHADGGVDDGVDGGIRRKPDGGVDGGVRDGGTDGGFRKRIRNKPDGGIARGTDGGTDGGSGRGVDGGFSNGLDGGIEVKPGPKTVVTPAPRKYTANAIHFNMTWDYSGKTVEFADDDYIKDINKVVEIMKKDPTVEVTIEAYVGFTPGTGWLHPQGRGPDVYKKVGKVMDGRAEKIRSELVRGGISPDRIHTARGAAGTGAESRKVEFHFTQP